MVSISKFREDRDYSPLSPNPESSPSIELSCDRGHRAIRTSNDLHLRNAMRIPQDDADLGWRGALLRELADLVHDLLRGGFEPCWGRAGVRDRAGGDTFAVGVKATHLWWWCGFWCVDILGEGGRSWSSMFG